MSQQKISVSNVWTHENARRGVAQREQQPNGSAALDASWDKNQRALGDLHRAAESVPPDSVEGKRLARQLAKRETLDRTLLLNLGNPSASARTMAHAVAADAAAAPGLAAVAEAAAARSTAGSRQRNMLRAGGALAGAALLGTGAYLATRPNEKTAAYLAGYSSILAVFS